MIVTLLILASLVLALIEEFRAQGRNLLAWAVVALATALLIGRL